MINRNQAQIATNIEQLMANVAANFREICELLIALDKHYLHRDPMFKWYRQVANGKLVPALIMAMVNAQRRIKHMVGRPREVQINIAEDKPLDWCRVVKGEIEVRRGSWRQMSQLEYERTFPEGGPVRTVLEQRAIIEKELAAEPVTHIRRQPLARVDVTAQTFTLGNQTVPLSIVLSALREAGVDSNDVAP
jgi:hypothetical protein